MATEQQIIANRLNALRSTGPRTDSGKFNSRQNAVRHGLTAQTILIPGEDPEEFNQFRDDIIEEFDPAGRTETVLVERLVGLLWRLRRVPALEAALYAWVGWLQSESDQQEEEEEDDLRVLCPPPARNLRLLPSPKPGQQLRTNTSDQQLRIGRILEVMSERDLLNKLARHEAHLMNQTSRTLVQLRQLIEQRAEADERAAAEKRTEIAKL